MHYRHDYTEARGRTFRRVEGGSGELLGHLRHASRLRLDPSLRDFPREASLVGMEPCLDGWLTWLRPKGEYALDIHYVPCVAVADPNPFRMLCEREALPVAGTERVDRSALDALPGDSNRPMDVSASLDYLGAPEEIFVLEAAGRSRPIRFYLSFTQSDKRASADTVDAWFHFDAETGIRRPEELRRRLQFAAAPSDALREGQPKPSTPAGGIGPGGDGGPPPGGACGIRDDRRFVAPARGRRRGCDEPGRWETREEVRRGRGSRRQAGEGGRRTRTSTAGGPPGARFGSEVGGEADK